MDSLLTLFPRCIKCTKTETFIGKGAHFDRLNNRSLFALSQALSERGTCPVVLSNFTQMGLSVLLIFITGIDVPNAPDLKGFQIL
jgi:hypothetical protein